MPQKPVYYRSPLMAVHYCFPAAGTVRSTDKRITRLYQKASQYIEQPCVWEGLFRLACLVKQKPVEEPVADKIINALSETEDGSFGGSLWDQVCTARSAMAVFEYNTDRSILKRISEWLRFIEIEYDAMISQDGILFRPADLMELLIRFYQASGFKPSLRLCAKLRADAFDWTTAIHTFQQSIPISTEDHTTGYIFPEHKPQEIDYEEKEKLINHSEMLADGIRYTLFTGIFSGHSQDLSSGKTIWPYLFKHHHALCGGTTGNPYLSGSTADQTVNNCTMAAWTEAFCAQIAFADYTWASEELIRIVRNGIDYCLNQENLPDIQRINSICEEKIPPSDPARLYARIARAVASAYSHAVSLTEKGIMILYLLPGRYLVNIQKQMMMLMAENDSVEIHCKKPVSVPIDVYLPTTGTLSVYIERKRKTYAGSAEQLQGRSVRCIHLNTEWQDRDVIRFVPDETIICEGQHHQGISFLYRNRLMCMRVIDGQFARAVYGTPEKSADGKISVPTTATEKWKIRETQPADIPVLPETKEEPADTELIPYSESRNRITMFPRKRQ